MGKVNTKLDMLRSIFKDSASCDFGLLAACRKEFNFLGDRVLYNFKDKVAEIVFCTNGTAKHYSGLNVSINHKTHGNLSNNVFLFEQYLRSESIGSHASVREMYVWENDNLLDWYIVCPKTTKPILQAILDYINVYN
jgi:hypothetical protein